MLRERPRIGITMRIELETNRFYLARDYSEAVEAAGGIPVHISLIPRIDYIAAVMDTLDGVLLPGSDSDVGPQRYGKEPHARLGSVHPLKDDTDALVLDQIAARGTPLLAICFGMQIFNVIRGGTLIQDIETQLPDAIKHQQGKPRDHRSHRVRLLEGSILAGLAEAESVMVNSHHHQAIEKVGKGLIATAWTSDGLIEALEVEKQFTSGEDIQVDWNPETGIDLSEAKEVVDEVTNAATELSLDEARELAGDDVEIGDALLLPLPGDERFVLAVQWHPEIGWQQDEFSKAMFRKFVEAARTFAAARCAEHVERGEVSAHNITT